MKKMGRPTNNPKSSPIHVRLDDECTEILKLYCEQEHIKKTEAIRQGIKLLADKIKNKEMIECLNCVDFTE